MSLWSLNIKQLKSIDIQDYYKNEVHIIGKFIGKNLKLL